MTIFPDCCLQRNIRVKYQQRGKQSIQLVDGGVVDDRVAFYGSNRSEVSGSCGVVMNTAINDYSFCNHGS